MPAKMSRSPTDRTFGSGPGQGMMSPSQARCACATGAELSNPARSVSRARRSAAGEAGITPRLATIAAALHATPSASSRIPASRRFAHRKTPMSA